MPGSIFAPNCNTNGLLRKIIRYIDLQPINPVISIKKQIKEKNTVIDAIKYGVCMGYSILWSYCKHISTRPVDATKPLVARDDITWFYSMLDRLAVWDGISLETLGSASDISEVDRFISQVLYFQQVPRQQEWYQQYSVPTLSIEEARSTPVKSIESSYELFTITGVVTSRNLARLFAVLLFDESMCIITSSRHAIAVRREGNHFYIFDSNDDQVCLFEEQFRTADIPYTVIEAAIECIECFNFLRPKDQHAVSIQLVTMPNSIVNHAVINHTIKSFLLSNPQFFIQEPRLINNGLWYDHHIYLAVETFDQESLQYWIEQDPRYLNLVGPVGYNAAFYCLEVNNLDALAMLLKHKDFDVEATCEHEQKNNNLLHMAVLKGNLAAVKLIIDSQLFDINSSNDEGELVFELAIQCPCSLDMMTYLLSLENIDFNVVNGTALPIISDAILQEDTDTALLLIRDGRINKNAKDIDNETTLMTAVIHNHHLLVMELLKDDSVDVNARNKDGKTAFFMAIENDDEAMITILLGCRKLDIYIPCHRDIMPLRFAVENQLIKISEKLLEHIFNKWFSGSDYQDSINAHMKEFILKAITSYRTIFHLIANYTFEQHSKLFEDLAEYIISKKTNSIIKLQYRLGYFIQEQKFAALSSITALVDEAIDNSPFVLGKRPRQ